jgi:hypothetical protein
MLGHVFVCGFVGMLLSRMRSRPRQNFLQYPSAYLMAASWLDHGPNYTLGSSRLPPRAKSISDSITTSMPVRSDTRYVIPTVFK